MLGGARPNSGPKKGSKHKKTIEQELLRERLMRKVGEKWDDLIEAQIDKAKGIKLEAISKDGEIYYKDPGPDTFAFKTISEQTIGKPKESIEHSGEIKVKEVILDM